MSFSWDEIPEDESFYLETDVEGDADNRRLIYVEGGMSTIEDSCSLQLKVSDWTDSTLRAFADGEELSVSEEEGSDGSVTFFISGSTGANLQLQFELPPGDHQTMGLTLYPPQYSNSVLYETFSGNEFDQPWSNVQQIPKWAEKWEEDYEFGDLINISRLMNDTLETAFNFDGGASAVYYRYLSIQRAKAGEFWISYFYNTHQWENEDLFGVEVYLGLYTNKGNAYSGMLINLNRLTAWFYGMLELTQDLVDTDNEIVDCKIDDSGVITVKPWSMYTMSDLTKQRYVEKDSSPQSSELDEGDEMKHAMLMVKAHTEIDPVLFAGSNWGTIYRINTDTMTLTHQIGCCTDADGVEPHIWGFDHGTDGYLYAVGSDINWNPALLKLNPDDLSIIYKAIFGGQTLAFPAFSPIDGYLYIAEGYRDLSGLYGEAGRIYKVDPSNGSIVDKLEGGFIDSYDGNPYTDVCISYLYLGTDGYLYAITDCDEYQIIKVNPDTMEMVNYTGDLSEDFCTRYRNHICLDKYNNVYTGITDIKTPSTEYATTWQPNTYYDRTDPAFPTSPNGYVYRTVWDNYEYDGYSGSTEPIWPTTVGEQVADYQLIWECCDPNEDYICETKYATKTDSSLSHTGSLDQQEGNNDYSLAAVFGPDGYHYIGTQGSDGVSMYKVDPSDMTLVDTYIADYAQFHSMVFDAQGFLYAHEYNKIHKIDVSNMSLVAAFEPANNNLEQWGDIIGTRNRYKMLESL